MYTRYGHVNQIFVKAGDKVKVGQKIATNGTGNGQWLAHLHRDHPKEIPNGNYGFYNIGWTKEKTVATFNDPTTYPKALGSLYDHLGYGWLEFATYSTGKCYHPGLDENGKGSGNTDLDDPVYAVTDGVVEYVYAGTGTNGGWGHLIVIKELITNEAPMNEDFAKAVGEVCGEDWGKNLNDGEQKDAAKKLKEVKEKLAWGNQLELTNTRLLDNNGELAKKLKSKEEELSTTKDAVEAWHTEYGILERKYEQATDDLRIQTEKAQEGVKVYGALELIIQAVKNAWNKEPKK